MDRFISNAGPNNRNRRTGTRLKKSSFWEQRVRKNAAIACSSIFLALATVGSTFAQTIDVGTSTDFVNAVQTLNGDPNSTYTLNFTSGFTMGQQSNDFAGNSTTILSGNLNTIDGAGLYQPLIIDSGTVVLQSLMTINTNSPITINGGTLVDSDNSLQGAVTNNGAVKFSQLVAASYTGNMSGTGTVEVSGVGPVTFSGLNSYTGGTTVDLGASLIGTTDSLQGGFTNNGAVQFSQLVAGTYAGSMSGTGKCRDYRWTGHVHGINSYSGGTTVDAASTLIGTTDSLQGGITNNGAVQFSQLVAGDLRRKHVGNRKCRNHWWTGHVHGHQFLHGWNDSRCGKYIDWNNR